MRYTNTAVSLAKTQRNSDWLTVTQQAWGWDMAPVLICPALLNGLGHWTWHKASLKLSKAKNSSMVAEPVHKMRINSALEWLKMFTCTHNSSRTGEHGCTEVFPQESTSDKYLWIRVHTQKPTFLHWLHLLLKAFGTFLGFLNRPSIRGSLFQC